MTETLGDLRNRKLAKLFEILDSNGDGVVSLDDFEEFGGRVATVAGQRDAAKIAEMKNTLKMIWDEFESGADGDNDRRVTEQEFIGSLLTPQATDPAKFIQFVGLTCNLLFGIADTDGDGRISEAEHMLVGREVMRLSDTETAESFDKLDFWKRGYLTMDQYVVAYTEFLTSSSSDSNGNWLLGKY
ncbi:EF-hand domain-containing protein [Nocardia sp. NPDC051570]|uniref:EF-hand domain-containing protein n=1 Tax=Nocardia sp. NPDC051570 TaxID=3364324 RepID=UPI0037A3E539